MRDYGADISCPTCGQEYHLTPRRLQADLEIVFLCQNCGTEVVQDNPVAREIADHFETIKHGLRRIDTGGYRRFSVFDPVRF
jgi:hypothetical protein